MRSNRPYVQIDPSVIEQARQMDLLSYLQRYEPSTLKRVAGNVYCTKEHDSLKTTKSLIIHRLSARTSTIFCCPIWKLQDLCLSVKGVMPVDCVTLFCSENNRK